MKYARFHLLLMTFVNRVVKKLRERQIKSLNSLSFHGKILQINRIHIFFDLEKKKSELCRKKLEVMGWMDIERINSLNW